MPDRLERAAGPALGHRGVRLPGTRLEDLLAGLDKHWQEQPDDLNRGRIYAQELLKHQRLQRAEQVLSKLVAKGGNVNARESVGGQTALMWAAGEGQTEVVKVLLEAGADPNVVGKTVLLNDRTFEVVGVAPEEFKGTEIVYTPEMWMPMTMAPAIEPGSTWLDRRSNGVEVKSA